MASVHIDYRGRLPLVERQEQLLPYVERLARIRTRLDPVPYPSASYNGPIQGRIFIAQRLFDDALARAGGLAVLTREARSWLRNAEVVGTLDSPAHYILVNQVEVHGIEFRLYDWEEWWPGQDGRLSICFLRIPALPHVDGSLVKVLGANDDPGMPPDTFMIRRPTISLRYDFEDWFDSFFSWIKLFFMRDLYYWHWDPMRCYEAFARRVRGRVPSLDCCPRLRHEVMTTEFDRLARLLSEESCDVGSRPARVPPANGSIDPRSISS